MHDRVKRNHSWWGGGEIVEAAERRKISLQLRPGCHGSSWRCDGVVVPDLTTDR